MQRFPASDRRWAKWGWDVAIPVLLFVVFLYFSKIWDPNFIDMESGDYSLMFINHYIFPRAAEFAGLGINTTGRWSILLWNLYWPETYALHVLSHVAITGLLFHLLYRWMRAAGAALWSVALLVLLLALALARSPDAKFLLLPALLPLVMPELSRQRTSPTFLILLVMVALSAHVKGTFLLAAIFALPYVAAMELYFRRLPLNAFVLILAFLGWMSVAGIAWSDAWDQLDLVLTSGTSYGELYSDVTPLFEFLLMAGCIGVAGIGIILAEVRRGPAGYLAILIWGLLLFLVFKTAAVMATGQHYIRWIVFLVSFGVMAGARHWPQVSPQAARLLAPSSVRWGFLALALLVGGGILIMPATRADARQRLGQKIDLVSAEFRHIARVGRSMTGGRGLGEVHQQGLQRVRERTPLPELADRVGVYSSAFFTVPMAHGLRLEPLPILAQSEGWTPGTVRKNRAYLAGASAPPFMLIRENTGVDNVVLAIFEYYAPDTRYPPFLLLKKAGPGSRAVRVPAGEATLAWGETLKLPAVGPDGMLALEYAYRPSFLARMLDILYRPPPVSLEMLDARAETVRSQRLASEMGSDGVLLTTRATEEVLELALIAGLKSEMRPRGLAANSIRFVAGFERPGDWLYGPGSAWWFAPSIKVRFHTLRFTSEGAGHSA